MYNDDIAKTMLRTKPLDYKLVTELIEKLKKTSRRKLENKLRSGSQVQNFGVSIDSVKMFLFQLEKKLESTIHQLAVKKI